MALSAMSFPCLILYRLVPFQNHNLCNGSTIIIKKTIKALVLLSFGTFSLTFSYWFFFSPWPSYFTCWNFRLFPSTTNNGQQPPWCLLSPMDVSAQATSTVAAPHPSSFGLAHPRPKMPPISQPQAPVSHHSWVRPWKQHFQSRKTPWLGCFEKPETFFSVTFSCPFGSQSFTLLQWPFPSLQAYFGETTEQPSISSLLAHKFRIEPKISSNQLVCFMQGNLANFAWSQPLRLPLSTSTRRSSL